MHDQAGTVNPVPNPQVPDDILHFETTFSDVDGDGFLSFDRHLEQIVAFQRDRIPVYDRYLGLLGDSAAHTPHLPIESFKQHSLCAVPLENVDAVFVSSGTTSTTRSHHYVYRLSLYEKSIRSCFERRFGTGPFTFVALLPGYEEAGSTSSLLYMVRCLIRNYGDEESGFFHGRHAALQAAISWSQKYGTRLLVFGVAFGLLDLLETMPVRLHSGSLVIETGGMKTRRQEIRRSDLHERLAVGFGLPRENVLSEYGMAEMLSQCYTRGGEVFYPPPWVRVEIRDPSNPLEPVKQGQPGVLAVIDLANMYSVSAILTEDLGVEDGDGFRVLGRLQGSELRGCNMLLDPIR